MDDFGQQRSTNDDGILVTGFSVGSAFFALEAKLVEEVVKPGVVTKVHEAPPEVIGIRNLRGKIVTVIDMATHLGLGQVNKTEESRLLIMESKGEYFGFMVDYLTDTLALDERHIDAPPASLEPLLRQRLRGVWHEKDRLTAILSPEGLFLWDQDRT